MHHRSFMFALAVVLSLGATTLISIPASTSAIAQAAQPATAAPGRVQKFRERTKESWTQMKRRWSMQREKYSACRKEARAQRLVGRKTRKFLDECMSR